jgi:hypothetical protein
MNTTSKTLCALLLGAALTTPALAQDTAANATPAAPAADNAAPIAAPTTPVQSTTTIAANTNSAASASAGTQTAMNSTGNAADLSSVPDTQKKYVRSNRARDYKKETAVTAQLNQKESSLNGATSQQ